MPLVDLPEAVPRLRIHDRTVRMGGGNHPLPRRLARETPDVLTPVRRHRGQQTGSGKRMLHRPHRQTTAGHTNTGTVHQGAGCHMLDRYVVRLGEILGKQERHAAPPKMSKAGCSGFDNRATISGR